MILDKFLYKAMFIPEGIEATSKSIIKQPELQVYVSDFGKKDDCCLVAEVDEMLELLRKRGWQCYEEILDFVIERRNKDDLTCRNTRFGKCFTDYP